MSQITLPPDTEWQRLRYEQIEPLPEKIETDPDGNWIATYRLDPNADILVSIRAKAQLKLTRNNLVPTPIETQAYVNAQDFWQVKEKTIQDLATNLNSAKDIYHLTTEKLDYTQADLSLDIRRLGAVEALLKPDQATCQEYTDLFIALARAKNIPARRAIGFANTQNTKLKPVSFVADILHTWPVYFDEATHQWQQIDPTWADTTGGTDYFSEFDLNHIVFAFNGLSSTTPYPAGSYQAESKPTKDVRVKVIDRFPDPEPNIELQVQPVVVAGIAIPGLYDLKILNRSGSAWYQIEISAKTDTEASLVWKDLPPIPVLLPFQHLSRRFSLYNTLGNQGKIDFSLTSPELATDIQTHVERSGLPSQLIQFNQFYPWPLLAVAGGGLIFAALTGSLFILGLFRKNSVRRKS